MRKEKMMLCAAGALCAASVGAAALCSVTERLLQMAIYREPPRGMGRARGRIKQTPADAGFDRCLLQSAKRLEERAACEEVEITSRDGLRLVGHWCPVKEPRRVIVAMHGWRSAWYRDFGMIADFWFNDGCSVLFAEQRGQNKSGGEYMTFGYLERYDCLDWVSWVNERIAGAYPIYLAGVSMGASTVLMAAGLELPDGVKGVIADCGFTSAYEIWQHVVRNNLRLSLAFHGAMVEELCLRRLHTTARGISAITALKRTRVPILFIHGSDDRFVPIGMTYENYKACAAKKELLVVPGAGHGQSYFFERARYEAAVRRLWQNGDLVFQGERRAAQGQ